MCQGSNSYLSMLQSVSVLPYSFKTMILLVGRNWSLSVEAEKNLSPSCHIDFSSQELSFCSKAVLPRLCFVSLGVSLS